jgi:transposase
MPPFYAVTMGRPGLPPGIYFRLLLVGYFEGIDSERGMAWRAGDSLSIRGFVGNSAGARCTGPYHDLAGTAADRCGDASASLCLGSGKVGRCGFSEGQADRDRRHHPGANAALRSIVRRDNGASYEEFLQGLARASGIETPTRGDLARVDRKRKKKGSNREWMNPHDPDARITKRKDGRTHLAHKAEHAVDLETGAVVAVTLQGADRGDTTTVKETLAEAGRSHRRVDRAGNRGRTAGEAASESGRDRGSGSG